MFFLSIIIAITACAGFINTGVYGYRLLSGVLFIFLCGSYMLRSGEKGKAILATVWLAH